MAPLALTLLVAGWMFVLARRSDHRAAVAIFPGKMWSLRDNSEARRLTDSDSSTTSEPLLIRHLSGRDTSARSLAVPIRSLVQPEDGHSLAAGSYQRASALREALDNSRIEHTALTKPRRNSLAIHHTTHIPRTPHFGAHHLIVLRRTSTQGKT